MKSILNDEIREFQKKNRIDHMKYLPDMEVLESDVMDQVLSAAEQYDPDMFTAEDVRMLWHMNTGRRRISGRFFLSRHFRCWKRLRSVQRRKREIFRKFHQHVHADLYCQLLREFLYLLRIQLP